MYSNGVGVGYQAVLLPGKAMSCLEWVKEASQTNPAVLACVLTSTDSGFARDAFTTFLPISVDSDARVEIIRDFFDLMAAVAAHGKTNGLSGRKLSRFAGWWAFEHYDTGKGFDAGYRSWIR